VDLDAAQCLLISEGRASLSLVIHSSSTRCASGDVLLDPCQLINVSGRQVISEAVEWSCGSELTPARLPLPVSLPPEEEGQEGRISLCSSGDLLCPFRFFLETEEESAHSGGP
jgi:hypothetical protein